MVLGKAEIERRVRELFPESPPYKIGAASADVRIGAQALIEGCDTRIPLEAFDAEHPFLLQPGRRILVDMHEVVHLPEDVAALFALKSTPARDGYNHAAAGWVDPGWQGRLTMEIKNDNQFIALPIYPGMPVGQLIFMETTGGGKYAGRYQGSTVVSGAQQEVMYNA